MLISLQNPTLRNRFGDQRTFELMKDAGFTAVDFATNSMKDFDEVVMGPDMPSHANRIRNMAEHMGLPIVGSHAPFKFKSNMAMDDSEPEFLRLVRTIAFAGELGAPLIVIHALRLQPEDRPEDQREEQDRSLEFNLRWYRLLEPYAKKAKIKIAVENLPAREPNKEYGPRLFGDGRSYVELLDQLDPEWFTGCFDVGHANLSVEDPAAFIREAGKYIHFLHVHDNDGHRDLHLMPAFSKLEEPFTSMTYKVDWKEIASALRDIHYDGPLNFEIATWCRAFSKELIPEALALAVKSALPMARAIEYGD